MKRYLKLIRPYGMLFLGFTPVFGAIANGEFALSHLIILLIIGLLAHIFTFVQNDYYDFEIDRKSKYVSNRPLVTGSISQKTTVALFASSKWSVSASNIITASCECSKRLRCLSSLSLS